MSTEIASIRKRNTAILAGIVVFGMLGAAYASVPLYRLFCQLTGYAGTTQVAEAAPGQLGDRVIKVVFDANTASL